MKPLNLDNSPCSPISSNCVIWQGPNIDCIKLCKGDTVSDVVYKLATELCTVMDTLNVTNYDLSCFNLTSCLPEDFQALINFLITKICELENIPAQTNNNTNDISSYLIAVPDCLGGGSLTLPTYVHTLATKICDLVNDVNELENSVNSLNIRVTALEGATPPSYTTPSFAPTCQIGSLPAGSQYIDLILEAFINDVWCDFYYATGTTGELIGAIAAQCVGTTDLTLQFKYSNPTQTMGAQYGGAGFTNATTVAEAIQSLWIALCDTRGRELMRYEVTTTDDITVSTSVVGSMTTFEIGRPAKEYYYDAVTSNINLSTQLNFVDSTYFQPLAYAGLSYTNTTGSTKNFMVRVSYDTMSFYDPSGPTVQSAITNYVDGAITKNGSTVVYESLGLSNISVEFIDSVSGTVIDSVTPETLVTTPSGHPVDISIGSSAILPKNTSFFAVVSLLNGESIQLKFRSKAGQTSTLLQAQFYIEEIR